MNRKAEGRKGLILGDTVSADARRRWRIEWRPCRCAGRQSPVVKTSDARRDRRGNPLGFAHPDHNFRFSVRNGPSVQLAGHSLLPLPLCFSYFPRGTVLVPIAVGGQLSVREYSLGADDVVLEDTFDFGTIQGMGALGMTLDEPDFDLLAGAISIDWSSP